MYKRLVSGSAVHHVMMFLNHEQLSCVLLYGMMAVRAAC